MAYSIVVNTRFAGSDKGTFLDDLTNSVTSTPAKKKITKIVVHGGNIIDSVKITYKEENSLAPVTVLHGGPGGGEMLSFDISASEKLLAVYGTQLVKPSEYGEKTIVKLSFIVANSSGGDPTTKVYTAKGGSPDPTEKFELSWPITTVSSYTLKPQSTGISYLQGIGFSNVLYKADSQVP
ncbi:hypothetical protein EI94DRAFT_1813248 [Lactarius quietus]|nr:hypothetical protein EI94DRAFT_1813248 [Lactarius quietus]